MKKEKMRSKRHTSFILALSFLVLTIRSAQSWAPASSSLERVAPVGLRRNFLAVSGQSKKQNFNRYVQVRGGTGNNDDVKRVQEEIRASFEASRVESSPDLQVPVGFILHTDRPEPSADELSNENMLRIILSMCTDEEVNELVWKCLGYRRVTDNTAEGRKWDATECFPKWRDRFPTPPDLVGITRTYTKEVDGPVLKANQALVRTVPMAYKQSIREHLRPEGFNGFKLAELTPNKTRRAQCANWLLYYREALFGVPLEELQRRKAADVEAENFKLRMEGKSAKIARPDGKTAEEVLAEKQQQ